MLPCPRNTWASRMYLHSGLPPWEWYRHCQPPTCLFSGKSSQSDQDHGAPNGSGSSPTNTLTAAALLPFLPPDTSRPISQERGILFHTYGTITEARKSHILWMRHSACLWTTFSVSPVMSFVATSSISWLCPLKRPRGNGTPMGLSTNILPTLKNK